MSYVFVGSVKLFVCTLLVKGTLAPGNNQAVEKFLSVMI